LKWEEGLVVCVGSASTKKSVLVRVRGLEVGRGKKRWRVKVGFVTREERGDVHTVPLLSSNTTLAFVNRSVPAEPVL
jgi:hypothetical protein